MSDTKKMPFHLTVTNNETGETVKTLDFDALVGSVHLAGGEAAGLFITKCSSRVVIETVVAGEHLIDYIKRGHPEVAVVSALTKLRGIEPEIEETEEAETKNEE